jgi:hypothetical protein
VAERRILTDEPWVGCCKLWKAKFAAMPHLAKPPARHGEIRLSIAWEASIKNSRKIQPKEYGFQIPK